MGRLLQLASMQCCHFPTHLCSPECRSEVRALTLWQHLRVLSQHLTPDVMNANRRSPVHNTLPVHLDSTLKNLYLVSVGGAAHRKHMARLQMWPLPLGPQSRLPLYFLSSPGKQGLPHCLTKSVNQTVLWPT